MKCPFCAEEIQDAAIKCRFCGSMLNGLQPGDQVVAVTTPTAPRNTSPKRKSHGVLATLLVLGVGAVVVYQLLPRGAKETVDEIAAHSGVAGHVVPWTDRADTALRQMLAGQDGATVARTIQAVLHETGENPRLRSYDLRHMGDTISVRFSVDWQGGIGAIEHTTAVEWEFNEHGHVSVTLLSDNGAFSPTSSDMQQLDNWFRAEFYPVLRSNAG